MGFTLCPAAVREFVLSHTVPEKLAKGETAFIFVTDGIESALTQAKAAAGDNDVAVVGGATHNPARNRDPPGHWDRRLGVGRSSVRRSPSTSSAQSVLVEVVGGDDPRAVEEFNGVGLVVGRDGGALEESATGSIVRFVGP